MKINSHLWKPPTTNHSPFVPGPLALADVPSSRVLSMTGLHPMQQLARLLHDLQRYIHFDRSVYRSFFRWRKKNVNPSVFNDFVGGLGELFYFPMVQWKMVGTLKGYYDWRFTHLSPNHDDLGGTGYLTTYPKKCDDNCFINKTWESKGDPPLQRKFQHWKNTSV